MVSDKNYRTSKEKWSYILYYVKYRSQNQISQTLKFQVVLCNYSDKIFFIKIGV